MINFKYVLYKCKEKTHDLINDVYYCLNKNDYDIEKYKGMYEGKSCFVIGNGPSLKPEDLDKVLDMGYVSFAANRIYNICKDTSWRPTFMGVSDYTFIQDRDSLERIQQIGCRELFIRSQFALDTRKNKCATCAIKTNSSRKLLNNPQFSLDCKEMIFDIASVTYFNLQIAAYMGFKTIYLIGMDNRYAYSKLRDGTIVKNEGVANYFDELGLDLPDPKSASPTWELDIAFEFAEKFSREHGFRILNATRGGFLETFERVDLDEILSKK